MKSGRIRVKKDHLNLLTAWIFTLFVPDEISFGLYKAFLILVLGLAGWLAANCFLSTSRKYQIGILSAIPTYLVAVKLLFSDWHQSANLFHLFFFFMATGFTYAIACGIVAIIVGVLGKYIEVID